MTPKREHTMYEGIYTRIRHPQAVGEFPLWWVLAFLAHSPFLVLFTCVLPKNGTYLSDMAQPMKNTVKKQDFGFPRLDTKTIQEMNKKITDWNRC